MLSLWLNVRCQEGLRPGLADGCGRFYKLWRRAKQNSAVTVVLVAFVLGVDRRIRVSSVTDPAVPAGIGEAVKLGGL